MTICDTTTDQLATSKSSFHVTDRLPIGNDQNWSSADSPSATIKTGHRHKHITTHGLSHIQLSLHRQPPLSATLSQTSHYCPFSPIYTLPILGTCPKTVSTLSKKMDKQLQTYVSSIDSDGLRYVQFIF